MRTVLAALAFVVAALPAVAQQAAAPKVNDPANTVVLDTTKGRVVIHLRPDLAPKHAERIKTLTQQGFYNGVPFHRVIPGFMAQTGDPTGTGTGKSKLPDLPAEFSDVPFKRGSVGMARSASPNSANSQFFIVYGDAPWLNGQYTYIGDVVSGMDVVDKIKKGSQSNNGQVSDPDKIVTMTMAGAK